MLFLFCYIKYGTTRKTISMWTVNPDTLHSSSVARNMHSVCRKGKKAMLFFTFFSFWLNNYIIPGVIYVSSYKRPLVSAEFPVLPNRHNSENQCDDNVQECFQYPLLREGSYKNWKMFFHEVKQGCSGNGNTEINVIPV